MNAKIIKVSDYEDKFITCIDCSDEFLWTASEQAYLHLRNYPHRNGVNLAATTGAPDYRRQHRKGGEVR